MGACQWTQGTSAVTSATEDSPRGRFAGRLCILHSISVWIESLLSGRETRLPPEGGTRKEEKQAPVGILRPLGCGKGETQAPKGGAELKVPSIPREGCALATFVV